MKTLNFNDVLFRASANGNLMTEPKSKAEKEAGELSQTTKSYLLEVYIQERFNRRKEFTNKYVQKGLQVEEDAITLFSLENKFFFEKNEEHWKNEFVKGTPDIFRRDKNKNIETVFDIKSSWDIFTFFKSKTEPINKLYYWQLQTYIWLTGAKNAELVYCLVNTPEQMIIDAKRKLSWQMGLIDDIDADYQKACEEIDRSMVFDDIPRSERIHRIKVERNDEDIEKLKNKIIKSREYLKTL